MGRTKTEKLSKIQFIFLMFNYVVGFGLLSTIGEIIQMHGWGLLIFLGTILIMLGVILIFGKLAEKFPNVEGSSYGFAKETHGRFFTFFQGWNQFIQGPILAASTPIFLQAILSHDLPEYNWLWRTISITLYTIFIVLSTLKISLSFKWISYVGYVKWLVFAIALVLAVVMAGKNNHYVTAFVGSETFSIATVTGAMLSFIFAYGGIAGMTTLTRDVKAKNFKKVYLSVFGLIVLLYFIFYIILLGALKIGPNDQTSQTFRIIFNSVLGLAGVVIFFVGTIFNKASSVISSSIVNARILGPLGQDNYLPEILGHKSKNDIFVVSTFVSSGFALISMVIFQIIPEYVDFGDSFIGVIKVGTAAFLIQYFTTGITALVLYKRKEIKFRIWELFFIILMFALITFVLLSQLIPPVIGETFSTKAIVIDASYLGWMLLGFIAWGLTAHFRKRKAAKG